MNTDQNKSDQVLKEKLEQFQFDFDPAAWAKMEKLMDDRTSPQMGQPSTDMEKAPSKLKWLVSAIIPLIFLALSLLTYQLWIKSNQDTPILTALDSEQLSEKQNQNTTSDKLGFQPTIRNKENTPALPEEGAASNTIKNIKDFNPQRLIDFKPPNYSKPLSQKISDSQILSDKSIETELADSSNYLNQLIPDNEDRRAENLSRQYSRNWMLLVAFLLSLLIHWLVHLLQSM